MVRTASLLDINAIYGLSVEGWEGLPFDHIKLDEMKARQLISRHIKQKSMCMFVSEIDKEVVGYLAGSVSRMDMSDSIAAHNTALYVHSGSEGGLLVRKYVEWAKQSGAELIGIDQSYANRVDETTRFLKREGFKASGRLHYYADGL